MRAVAFVRSSLRVIRRPARPTAPQPQFALPAWSFRLSRLPEVRR